MSSKLPFKYVVGIETMEFGICKSLPMFWTSEEAQEFVERSTMGGALSFMGKQEDGSLAVQVFGKELVSFGRIFIQAIKDPRDEAVKDPWDE